MRRRAIGWACGLINVAVGGNTTTVELLAAVTLVVRMSSILLVGLPSGSRSFLTNVGALPVVLQGSRGLRRHLATKAACCVSAW